MPTWILTSIVLSVVLTVALNVLPRLFPGGRDRLERSFNDRLDGADGAPRSGVRVFAPWKLMIALSIGLTILLNIIV